MEVEIEHCFQTKGNSSILVEKLKIARDIPLNTNYFEGLESAVVACALRARIACSCYFEIAARVDLIAFAGFRTRGMNLASP